MELFFLITGTILFGEALALYIGVFLIKKGNITWNSKQNRLYLLSDSISGLIIALNYLFFEKALFPYLALIFIIISIASHFKRISEYLLKKENIFCANKALYFINNLKLIILFGSLFMVLPF